MLNILQSAQLHFPQTSHEQLRSICETTETTQARAFHRIQDMQLAYGFFCSLKVNALIEIKPKLMF